MEFDEFKADPTPVRLERLLTSVQDRVYNICFQILRRAEDAEDACQEVLIETARGLHRVDDPRAFKVWLYRVAVHTSLDRKEARDRRARLAPQPKEPPMKDADREELMRAIRTLDDRTRCLVLEHYFDKSTLEEIGAREGISAPAVFKRLERARETLRRALLGAGFVAAASGVAEALESITPVAAPAGMAGKVLLAGGAVMGTKSAITGGTIVAALLLAGAASTGGYLVAKGRSETRMRELEERLSKSDSPIQAQTALPSTMPPPQPLPDTALIEPKIESQAKADGKKDPGSERAIVPDPRTVHYGRPGRPDLKPLRNAETWDEFYKLASAMRTRLGAADLETLIFERVARELALSDETLEALRGIFDAERAETTRVIVDSLGGPAGYERKSSNWNLLMPEWTRLRDNVRQGMNGEYLKHLTHAQLEFFNEHLRNSQMGIESSYSSDGTYYLVSGVGRKLEKKARGKTIRILAGRLS